MSPEKVEQALINAHIEPHIAHNQSQNLSTALITMGANNAGSVSITGMSYAFPQFNDAGVMLNGGGYTDFSINISENENNNETNNTRQDNNNTTLAPSSEITYKLNTADLPTEISGVQDVVWTGLANASRSADNVVWGISSAQEGTHKDPAHPLGYAVDITFINGTHVSPSTSSKYTKALIRSGATKVYSPSGLFYYGRPLDPNKYQSLQAQHKNHIHVSYMEY